MRRFWTDADSMFLNHSTALAPFVSDLDPQYRILIPAGPVEPPDSVPGLRNGARVAMP